MSPFIPIAQARKIIGVGEKTFNKLGIPCYTIGKRRKYRIEDLENWLQEQREDSKCPSPKGKARRSTGTISLSRGLDFAEVVKRERSH